MASAKKAVEEAVVVVVTVADVVGHSTGTVKLVKRKSPPHAHSLPTLIISPSDSEKKVHNSWGGDDGEAERKTEEAATNDALAENAAGGLNDWAAPAADPSPNDWAAPADAPPADDWAAPSAAEGAEKPQSGERRERRGDREEEEDNTLTLDQYLAQQREKENALVPKLDVRKPNDGADDDVFQGAAPLQKDDSEYFAAKVLLCLYLLNVSHTSPPG